jgi:outer membrane protein assembly factor BamA
MKLPRLRIVPIIALLCCGVSVAAQSFAFKTIHFEGASQYTDAELATAAGLQTGVRLTAADLSEHTEQLLDTGLFENIKFTYNERELTFQLTPASRLYPIRLENFPVNFSSNLDNRLRARVPLYRGKVPGAGNLLTGVTEALREELEAMSISAAVTPNLYTDPNLEKITAMSFSIIDPPILVGKIKTGILSARLADGVRSIVAKSTGSAYRTEDSTLQLETDLFNLYEGQGYLDVRVQATAMPNPVVDKNGVHIPLNLSIEEGPQYRLASAQLARNSFLSQAEFDQQLGLRPGDVVDPAKLRRSCDFFKRRLHNYGHMRAKVTLTPTIDHAHGTISYQISADLGPIYTMGNLNVKNVSDDLRAVIIGAVHLPQGEIFNEGALRSMTSTQGFNPAIEHAFVSQKLLYTLNLNDDAHTVDVELTPETKN